MIVRFTMYVVTFIFQPEICYKYIIFFCEQNSAPRITPNGSPPRFSARYKGAELFVRKPSIGQAVVPSITTSSTTISTPIEVRLLRILERIL